MNTLNLLHLGMGNVGNALRDMIIRNSEHIKKSHGMDLKSCGFFTSKSGYFYPFGFPFTASKNYQNESFATDAITAIEKIQLPFVLIDTTASDTTYPLILTALERGGYVVMSNKKPLSGSQKQFDILRSYGQNRVLFETTVGAALPVINTLHDLLLTGDEILEINGCFSGTLGFICSMMEDGMSYSEAVKQAKDQGFTEPDPRDDLSGMDVTRKALILSRVLGYKLEITNISREAFFPDALKECSVDEFMKKISNYDTEFSNKFSKAKKLGNTLRYSAHISQNNISVKLTEVPLNSQLGRLKGPDNIVIYKTKRYSQNPLIIQGPGAGAEVTAGGVLADILKIGK